MQEKEEFPELQKLYERGVTNGVEGLRILDREETLAMEPNVTDDVLAALYAPTAGIVCPFELNMALAENACVNGVEFRFSEEVKDIVRSGQCYELHTGRGTVRTKYVINAAGVYADVIHNMVSQKKLHITPRNGRIYFLRYASAIRRTHTGKRTFRQNGC